MNPYEPPEQLRRESLAEIEYAPFWEEYEEEIRIVGIVVVGFALTAAAVFAIGWGALQYLLDWQL